MQQGGRLRSQHSNPYLCFALVSPPPIQQGTPLCALLYTTQDSTTWCFHFWKVHTLEKVNLCKLDSRVWDVTALKQQSEQLLMAAPVLLAAMREIPPEPLKFRFCTSKPADKLPCRQLE